jgi:imidazolonepropionase-like amidohydrolase
MPASICDGPEEVRKKVREVLRAGAEVVKVCSTGGVLSPVDHPNYTQFSPEELAIMVQEAEYRGAYVMTHAQGTLGIKNAIRAGMCSIEHGMFLDQEAIDMMLQRGTFLGRRWSPRLGSSSRLSRWATCSSTACARPARRSKLTRTASAGRSSQA